MDNNRICPKCSYERKANDNNLVPVYECPQCGIIYDKFIQSPKHENESPLNSETETTESQNSKTFSFNPKLLYLFIFLLISIAAVYTTVTKSSKPKSDLAGTYTGEYYKDNLSAYVEIDVDDQQRITRTLVTKKRTPYMLKGAELEETYLWRTPDSLEITYNINDYENHYTLFKIYGNKYSVEINEPEAGFNINFSFNMNQSEKNPQTYELAKYQPDQNIYYIHFDHNNTFEKITELQLDHNNSIIPEQIGHAEMRKYCSEAKSEISRVLSEFNRSGSYVKFTYYRLKEGCEQCYFFHRCTPFRPQIKFNLLQRSIHGFLSAKAKGEAISDKPFNTDTKGLTRSLIIPKVKIESSIVLDSGGYGYFEHVLTVQRHPNSTVGEEHKIKVPISSDGLDISEKDINIDNKMWRTIFKK